MRRLPPDPRWRALYDEHQGALMSASFVGPVGHLARTGRSAPAWRATLQPRQWWYVAPSPRSPEGIPAEGPWTSQHLQQAIESGVIEGTRLVWSPGMESWQPAGQQDEFAFYFAPPPLPAA